MASRTRGGEQGGTFSIGDTPSDDAPAEDVDDHVKVEVGPLGWPHQLGDVPGPDFVGSLSQEFWFLISGMAELVASLADFAMVRQDAVERPGSSTGTSPRRAASHRSRAGARSTKRGVRSVSSTVLRSASLKARAGFGRWRRRRDGSARRRYRLARDTPRAAQTAWSEPRGGAVAIRASMTARRRSAAADSQAGPQLFFGGR